MQNRNDFLMISGETKESGQIRPTKEANSVGNPYLIESS